jgi:hypothetical protein
MFEEVLIIIRAEIPRMASESTFLSRKNLADRGLPFENFLSITGSVTSIQYHAHLCSQRS